MDFMSLLESDEWPPNSDELLDNFFSLDGGIFDLAASDMEDLNSFPTLNGQGNNTAGSLAGSDSGLSMDHADFDMLDQQLSPLMMTNPQSDDDMLSMPSVNSKKSSAKIHSPASSVSPSHSSPPSSVGSPVECYEDKTDISSCQNNAPKDTQPVQTFQNTITLKRKSSTPLSPAAVVLPKIQKHYINKTDTVPAKNITIPRHERQRIILGSQNSSTLTTNVQSTDVSSTQKKIIRVAPIAGNPRSILLPVTFKDMKDFRSIKIINATDLKNPANIKLAAANFLQKSKQAIERKKNNLVYASFDSDEHQYIMEDSTSERGSTHSDEDDDDQMGDEDIQVNRKNGQFPRLELTAEERRLLVKEGITLPSSYPLTRLEERELKRIRRKIRNKISAQDSRRRKKEYVDGLEDRVKQCSEENQTLMKKIKALQSQNQSLASQLKKLQTMVTKGSGHKSTQPATCLMVLLLSVALVMAPSLRTGNGPAQARSNQGPSPPGHAPHNALLNSIRRALLSAHTLTPPATNGVIPMDESAEEIVNVEEMSSFGQPLSDHNYPLMECPIPVPGGRYTTPGYMDIPLDDGGTSPKNDFAAFLKNQPVKLEKFEYDQEFDENEMTLSHHEEIEEIVIDNKDIKDDTIKLYDAAMEKLEILENQNRFSHISGKLNELLDFGPQMLQIDPNSFIANKNKNFTKVKNVVMMANLELQ